MKTFAAFLTVVSAASLLACGNAEEAAVPAAPPPGADAPQAESAPTVAAAPATPTIEAAPSVAAPPTQAETKRAQPAMASKPAPVMPVESGAGTAADATVPAAASSDLAHGQQIYRKACAFCHDRGVAGAPKTGDVAVWSPRLAQGMETLYTVAVRGKGAMPAKGGNPSLSDADVRAAVDYMIAQSR